MISLKDFQYIEKNFTNNTYFINNTLKLEYLKDLPSIFSKCPELLYFLSLNHNNIRSLDYKNVKN